MAAQHRDSFAYAAFRHSLKEHQKLKVGGSHPVAVGASSGRPASAAPRRNSRPGSAKSTRQSKVSQKPGNAAGSGLAALRAKTASKGNRKGNRGNHQSVGNAVSRSECEKPSKKILDVPGMRSLDVNLIPLEDSYKKSCERLVALWEELRVPMRDREFFFRAYCQSSTPQNVARVRAQLDLVLRHRDRTLSTLESITNREQSLGKVVQILSRVSQNCVNTSQDCDISGDMNRTSGFIEFDVLAKALVELRQDTCKVVAGVCEWRKDLWRPQPFVWKGINYLVKTKSDISSILAENHIIRGLETSYGISITEPVFFSKFNGREPDCALKVHDDIYQEIEQCLQVIQTESKLQKEVYAENKRLLMSGYYIPLLRWSPDDAVVIKPRLKQPEDQVDEENDTSTETMQIEKNVVEDEMQVPKREEEEESKVENELRTKGDDEEDKKDVQVSKTSAKEHLTMLREFQERIKSEL